MQIVRAHARDFTMAAAGHAYGMAPVCDRYYAHTKFSNLSSTCPGFPVKQCYKVSNFEPLMPLPWVVPRSRLETGIRGVVVD